MTWYANRIYLNASPAALARLRAESALVGHVFRLTATLPASWEPQEGKITLPEGGLLVVKEVGEPEDRSDSHAATPHALMNEEPLSAQHSWYRPGDFVSWHALRGPPDIDVLDGASIRDLAQSEKPPAPLLRFLKDIHATTGVPVTYYGGRTWGGEFEGECAWVFADREVVYGYLSPTETVEIDRHGRRLCQGDVIRLALAHHGLELPTGYFAPHTRGFDWSAAAMG